MDNNEPINKAAKHYNSDSPSTPNNNENKDHETRDIDFEYTINDKGTVEITKYTGKGGNVVIPSTIKGKNVAEIGQYSFENCTGLTSITIPDTVTTIWWNAFEGCTALSNVILPESVTAIHRSAFRGCTSLSSIMIPDSVNSIDERTFYGCTNLVEIKVSENNPVYADYNGIICDKEIKIIAYCPEGKKGEIKIPDSVTRIDDNAFDSCLGITSITIPKNVIEIGNAAFTNCKNLDDVYYLGNKESWNKISIDTGNDSLLNAKLHCSDDKEKGALGNYDVSRDSWGFPNAKTSFSEFQEAGPLNIYFTKNYYILPERYEEVFGTEYTAVATLRGEETYKSMIPTKWGGNCFGMVYTSALFQTGSLNWDNYNPINFNCLNAYYFDLRTNKSMDPPFQLTSYATSGYNTEITRLIESYQIWQQSADYVRSLLDEEEYYIIEKETDKKKTVLKDTHQANGKYVDYAVELLKSSDHPLKIGIRWGNKGHALLAYGWEKEDWSKPEEDGWYKIFVYDCNFPYPNSAILSSGYSPYECYTTSLNYLEMNPKKNIWRYEKASDKSGSSWNLIGCDKDNKPISRSTSVEYDNKNCKYEQIDTFTISDPLDAPTHFDGTARSDKLDEERAKLFVTPESNISIVDESGETICVATSGTVIPLGEGVDYHTNVGDTEEDGDYSIGNSTITLPCSKFTIKYYGGDDVTVFGNGEIVNLKFDNDANVDVDLDNLKVNVNSLSDNKIDVQLSRTSDSNALSSVLSTGSLSNGDSISLKLDGNAQFDAQLTDSNSNSTVDIYAQTESSNGRGYIETLSGNKTIQTKVKNQQESNNENTAQTKSPNTATTGNMGNTTSPANETVSNVTTGDSTNACMIAIIFGLSMIVILITVRRKKIIVKN